MSVQGKQLLLSHSTFDSVLCVVMQRILKVDYTFPPQVKASRECRDMLDRILVADPKKRITIPEIQRHPWYRKDLPPGVVDMNDHLPPPSPGAQVRHTYMPPPLQCSAGEL